MKKSLFLLLSVALIFTAIPVNALVTVTEEEKELAKELEFIFEEAMIKDETGTPIGLDIEKVEY